MEYILVTFRAKSETLSFASILKSYNISSIIVNTPRKINISCGISVKIKTDDFFVAKSIILRRNFDTFGGIYHIKEYGANMVIKQLM